MSFAGTVARLSKKFGTAWTLQKRSLAAGANAWTAGSLTQTYTGFTAQGHEATPEETKGGILQGDWIITADPATFSATPAAGDRIAQGTFANDATGNWLHIVDVRAPSEGASTRVWKVHARR